jgi:GNAT superfamily N-acetyltransferase
MEVEIRAAEVKEIDNVLKLNYELFKLEFSKYDKTFNLEWTFSDKGKKYFADKINKDNMCLFIAISDDQTIGYLSAALYKESEYRKAMPIMAELESFFVLEKYRNAGVGSRLFKAFCEWCKSKNVGRLRVQASANNIKAIEFYKKNGFNEYDLILETDIKNI